MALKSAAPAYAEQISMAEGVVAGMHSGNGPVAVTLEIRQSRVFAGFIPLGVLPPI